MNRLKAVTFAVMLAIWGAERPAQADVLGTSAEYTLESWDEQSGLPAGRIWGITQDAAGYLWLGMESGPVRFDGVRFVRWPPADGRPVPEEWSVYSLRAVADGSVWFGFLHGAIARIREDHLDYYGASAGIAPERIQFVFQDRQGTVWAGGPSHVYQFRNGRWDRADASIGAPGAGAFDAHEDRDGALWLSTTGGILRRRAGSTQFEKVDPRNEPLRFGEDSKGRLWLTDRRSGFRMLGETLREPAAEESGFGEAIAGDGTDAVWVGTRGQGLWRVRHGPAHGDASIDRLTVEDGLSSNTIRSVFTDRDGNVWVGTESGLHRFSRRKATALTDVGFSWAVESTPDGSVWIATSDGLIRLAGATRRRYGTDDGLPNAFVRALFTDVHGKLWVATTHGVARMAGDRFEPVPLGQDLPRVTSIAANSKGHVWIRDRNTGAVQWSNGELKPVASRSSPAGDATVSFVYVDSRDRVWLGLMGAKVAVTGPGDKTTVHSFGPEIGLNLTSAYEDRRGAIWVGGTRGLGRIQDGRVDVISQARGLPGDGVYGITEDADGHIWLGVSSGIVRLTPTDFELAARRRSSLRYRFYDTSDGLSGVPTRLGSPGAVLGADGQLWFTSSRGVNVISPASIDSGRATPRVLIESISIDDQTVALQPGAALPPGTSRLRFEYTALNLTSPQKERFIYKLDGIDADWVAAGSRREAFYPNLRSGSYRFQVARLSDDQSTPSMASWEFSILPRYYETWWFMSALVVAVGLVAWSAWQMRLRLLRRQFAVVMAERASMSRELHDTLLQDMVGVAIHFDQLAATIGTPAAPIPERIAQLQQFLRRSIDGARHTIWQLRSLPTAEILLPNVLRQYGEQTLSATSTHFTMSVTGTPRRCDPVVEKELVRIGQEALSNAARHANAASVTLVLEYTTRHVMLRVRDDGCGFDPDKAAMQRPGHYGFAIMRERAEHMGGQLRVDTQPGQGTTIEVTAPTTVALG